MILTLIFILTGAMHGYIYITEKVIFTGGPTMKLTRATDYALFLAAHLAELEPGENTSIGAVAAEYGIPERFLANIVNKLANAGIIKTLKGVNGGMRLARDPSLITVLEVTDVMEKSIALTKCQSADPYCPVMERCTVKGFMDYMYGQFRELLGRTTIETLKSYTNKEKLSLDF